MAITSFWDLFRLTAAQLAVTGGESLPTGALPMLSALAEKGVTVPAMGLSQPGAKPTVPSLATRGLAAATPLESAGLLPNLVFDLLGGIFGGDEESPVELPRFELPAAVR